ncbi:MAG: transposase family protein [Arhodomonas sp.]|nr:transposase family protein [Arhodomonas sp.]
MRPACSPPPGILTPPLGGGFGGLRRRGQAHRPGGRLCPRGSVSPCPACGAADQPVHDTRQRSWQHLHFFEHRAYIHAAVPRVRCEHCAKTTQVAVPWSRSGSGFTQLFEAMVVTLVRADAGECRGPAARGG